MEIKYWVSNPLEAVEDELIGCLHGAGNNQPITGLDFLYSTLQQLLHAFLQIMVVYSMVCRVNRYS